MKKKNLARRLTMSAAIATLYVLLTLLSSAFGLASGVIQIRLSEALTILPFFTATAIPGLSIGCFLSNLLLSAPLPDLVFGTLATFLGAVVARLLKKNRYLVPVPTILSNTLIIPFVLRYAYGIGDAMWFLMTTVFLGEVICAFVLGELLVPILKRQRSFFEY